MCCFLLKWWRNDNSVTVITAWTMQRKVTGTAGCKEPIIVFLRSKREWQRDTVPSNQAQYNRLQFPPVHCVYSSRRKYWANRKCQIIKPLSKSYIIKSKRKWKFKNYEIFWNFCPAHATALAEVLGFLKNNNALPNLLHVHRLLNPLRQTPLLAPFLPTIKKAPVGLIVHLILGRKNKPTNTHALAKTNDGYKKGTDSVAMYDWGCQHCACFHPGRTFK